MFNVNDTVKYGVNGVCKIVDISYQSFCGSDAEYYVLKPLNSEDSTFFVPTQNENLVSRMHKIMSENEVYDLIDEIPSCHAEWIDDNKRRHEQYNNIISNGTRKDVIGLIRTLHTKKQQLEDERKKMHVADEKLMKDAEKMINEEFAAVLNIKPAEVPEFIELNLIKMNKSMRD